MQFTYVLKRLFNMNYKSLFEHVKSVSQKSGKSQSVIFLDMIWCGFRYGAGYMDYDVIGFYKLNSKQRASMITRGKNNKIVKKLNKKKYWYIFDSKKDFNSTFSKYIGRNYLYIGDRRASSKQLSKEIKKFVTNYPTFFAKPNNGQCGKGIQKINFEKLPQEIQEHRGNGTIEKLKNYLVDNGLLLLEEPINQHKQMCKLNKSSVNTIRFVTLMNKNNDVTILTAFSRIGNGKVVDNFNSGGMTAKIDIETGKIIESAIDKLGNVYECHPITGTKIKDFQIPYFKEAKDMVIEAAKLSQNVRYIGWDVAITYKGPILVEGNQFPGHDIYQVAEKIGENDLGVWPKFKKALKAK